MEKKENRRFSFMILSESPRLGKREGRNSLIEDEKTNNNYDQTFEKTQKLAKTNGMKLKNEIGKTEESMQKNKNLASNSKLRNNKIVATPDNSSALQIKLVTGSKESNVNNYLVRTKYSSLKSVNDSQPNPPPIKSSETTKINLDFIENPDEVSFLLVAAEEQMKIIDALKHERCNFQRKIKKMESMSPKKNDENLDKSSDNNYRSNRSAYPASFEDSYINYLEEIFHIWVNLFCFINNLRINVIRLINIAGKESFTPNIQLENSLCTTVIECVKFLSEVKIKSLRKVLDNLQYSDVLERDNKNILDYEKYISYPFLNDMKLMTTKVQEQISGIKKKRKESTMS